MPINQLYHRWIRQILEIRPKERITRVRNFARLIVGIYDSRSVYLSRIAGEIPGKAKLLSTTKRLSRFIHNESVKVREWYEPLARKWLEAQHKTSKEVRLIVDGTKVGFTHQLLMVSLAYRKRSIPIAWAWVKHVRGHSTGALQIDILKHVRSLLPTGCRVVLVGDSEFGSIEVLKQLENWDWHYVLRQKGNTLIQMENQQEWQRFDVVIEKMGQSLWLGDSHLTYIHDHSTNLLAHWKAGEKEPWCLATNLPDRRTALAYYKRRMWIEEMFGDMKGHGFDLEHSMLHEASHLSRLTLAVVFLYIWLVSLGGKTIKSGKRHLVDRKDRRDLSIFQIGFRYSKRRLTNGFPMSIHLCFYS